MKRNLDQVFFSFNNPAVSANSLQPTSVSALCEGRVSPVQDVSRDDAMRGAEPGAELREEDVGADSQQQGLLLNEAIAASIKNTGEKKRWKCASMSG